MNYLAHIYLSGTDDLLTVGNFSADSIKGKKLMNYPKGMRKGIVLHRAIDTYTDSHPIVRQSTSRLFPNFSHYSSVIVDILYDHFLAKNWSDFHQQPLAEYIDEFYDLLKGHFDILPKRVQRFLPIMIEYNWLLTYATVGGIEKILYQMNNRTSGKSQMHLAVNELQEYYKDFEAEFRAFFKELEAFVADQIPKL